MLEQILALIKYMIEEVQAYLTLLMLMLINSIYPRANLVTKVTTAAP